MAAGQDPVGQQSGVAKTELPGGPRPTPRLSRVQPNPDIRTPPLSLTDSNIQCLSPDSLLPALHPQPTPPPLTSQYLTNPHLLPHLNPTFFSPTSLASSPPSHPSAHSSPSELKSLKIRVTNGIAVLSIGHQLPEFSLEFFHIEPSSQHERQGQSKPGNARYTMLPVFLTE